MFDNPKHQDITYDYNGKRIVYSPKIDPRTDFGRGISYKTCDGKDVATMEEVMLYNQMFYERMMNNSEEKGKHR